MKIEKTDLTHFPFEKDGASLMSILLVLVNNLKLIILLPLVFSSVAVINVTYLSKPEYTSSAKFMPYVSSSRSSQMAGIASQLGFSFPMTSSEVEWNYKEIIKSRTMAKKLLSYSFDTDRFGSQKELIQILTDVDKPNLIKNDTLLLSALGAFSELVKVSRENSMFSLDVTTFDPKLSLNIANGLLFELDKQQSDYNFSKNTQARKFIEIRLYDVESELKSAEDALKDFKISNRSIFESPQLQLEQARLTRDVSVITGVYTMLKQQYEAVKIEEVKRSDHVIILDHPSTPIHSSYNKRLPVVLSFLFGIGLSVVLAFFKEYILSMSGKEKDKIAIVKNQLINNIKDLLPKLFFKG